MKTTLALFGAAFLIVGAASAQNYSIDWFTIDGGGGTSSGGLGELCRRTTQREHAETNQMKRCGVHSRTC